MEQLLITSLKTFVKHLFLSIFKEFFLNLILCYRHMLLVICGYSAILVL